MASYLKSERHRLKLLLVGIFRSVKAVMEQTNEQERL